MSCCPFNKWCVIYSPHTHTHIHTHAHTCTHAHTHIHTHTCTYARMHTCKHACAHTHTHKHKPAEVAVESLVQLANNDTQADVTIITYLLSDVLSTARDINNTDKFSQVNTHHRPPSLLFTPCVHCAECTEGGRWSDWQYHHWQ